MSALPTRLVLNGRPWRVRVVSDLERKRGVVGLCQRWKKTILIDGAQSDEEQRLTLAHELLHALWPVDVVADSTEERIVKKLEERLAPHVCFAACGRRR
jgi:Zn-dependent peptidase ImmA (M78 family)